MKHLLKHYLTEEEKDHLELYLQMIKSKDKESGKLAAALFFEEFQNYKIPFYGYYKFAIVKLKFPNSNFYWKNRIENLLLYNYYCY